MSRKVSVSFAKASPSHLENIVCGDEATEKFIKALISMTSIDSIKLFTNTCQETFLLALKAAFEYTKFPVNLKKTFTSGFHSSSEDSNRRSRFKHTLFKFLLSYYRLTQTCSTTSSH